MPGWRCLAGSKRAAAGATSSEGGDGGGGGFGEAGVASPPFSTSRCPLPSHASRVGRSRRGGPCRLRASVLAGCAKLGRSGRQREIGLKLCTGS